MTFLIYITLVKPETQTKEKPSVAGDRSCFARSAPTIRSNKDNYSTFLEVKTCRVIAQVTPALFAASRCMPYKTYIAHAVTSVWCR